MRLSHVGVRGMAGLALSMLAAPLAGVTVGAAPAAAATPGSVVVSELMYNPVSDLDTDEFLELANTTGSPIDLSGWTFGGVTATLPAGSTIPAHGFFVLSPDLAQFHKTYGGNANATYTGKLSNGGETISVMDAAATVVDSVTYSDSGDWAVTPDGSGPSLELVDPAQDHNDPLNWAASTAAKGSTPGAANSVAHVGLAPRITGMTATPAQPAANQPVTVTATITGFTSATLYYRVDFGNEVTKALTSAGGDTYSAVLPGVAAGHLLRYRIQASNSAGVTKAPRVDDTIVYQGVEAQSGVTSAIPVLDWFIPDADYNNMVDNPLDTTIVEPSVLVYGGQVFDNATVTIRGNKPSRENPKQSFTFDLPPNHDLSIPGKLADPVDTFAMEATWADHSHGRQILSYNAYREAKVLDNETFPIRTQRNGSFGGLYLWVDKFDGTWRDREGYSDKQFFKAEDGAWDPTKSPTYRFTKQNPKDGDLTPVVSFVNGANLTGASLRNYLLANADLPEMINYAATTAIVQSVDSANHNFYLSQDPSRGRWSILPWDLDKTFGNGCCGNNSPFVTPAEPADTTTSLLMRDLLAQPDLKAMYFRRLRTLVDQILAPGHLEAEYDAAMGPAKPEADLDMNLWPTTPSMAYGPQRTSLFAKIQSRRTAFANDSRVPAAQSASPNIVINEIQHSPLGGGDAEFLELYNPSATEAVDLSGWSVSDAINLQIEPGTVILPHGYMTFVAKDPTFQATYGSSIFVGGTYSGGLSSAETITLQRADGSVDDQVAYGGAGWPQVTNGQSLELMDPASDNNVGSNWSLSATPGGTPGAPNDGGGGGPTNTPPTAAFTSSCQGLTCSFDGTGSHDDGTITGYAWTFGDGGTATGPNPSHTYTGTGPFIVTLTVTDNDNATGSVSHSVSPSTQSTPIAFVAATHGQGGSVKSQTVTVPAAAQAGQTMLLFFTKNSADTWSGPTGLTGWTQLDTFTNGSTQSTVWQRTVTAGNAGQAITFTTSAYHKADLVLAVYSGVDTTSTPVLAHSGDTNQSSHVSPTVSAPAGSWALTLWTDKSAATTGWTAPSTVTTRDTNLGTGSGRYTSLLTDSAGPTSGTYGGLTATTNATSTAADMWTIALPAPN